MLLRIMPIPMRRTKSKQSFVALAENPVRGGMLRTAGSFFGDLTARQVPSDFVTVAASVEAGSTPLKFRYLADYVRDFVSRPGEIAEAPPEEWRLQIGNDFGETTQWLRGHLHRQGL